MTLLQIIDEFPREKFHDVFVSDLMQKKSFINLVTYRDRSSSQDVKSVKHALISAGIADAKSYNDAEVLNAADILISRAVTLR